MTKMAGSGSEYGSISQRHRSVDPDPDPHLNVMDPQHWFQKYRIRGQELVQRIHEGERDVGECRR